MRAAREAATMATATFEPSSDTDRSTRYRIVPVGPPSERRWRLETAVPGTDDPLQWSTTSVHHTLATARYRARSLAQEQRSRDRFFTRLVIGGLALVGWPVVALSSDGLAALVISAALFALAVALLGAAIVIRFGDNERWAGRRHRETGLLDRMAAPVIASVRRQHAAVPRPDEGPVRVLPPDAHRSLWE